MTILDTSRPPSQQLVREENGVPSDMPIESPPREEVEDELNLWKTASPYKPEQESPSATIDAAVLSYSAIDLSSPSNTGLTPVTPPPMSMNMRRKSGIDIDGIHEPPDSVMAPAQLYSTVSGHLFHAGKIVVVTVGLPARGKTHISVALTRYLRWLGVKCKTFHLGDYRRAVVGPGKDVPEDYFFVEASSSTILLRQKIINACRSDIYQFLEEDGGQVAIYDAVNPLSQGRRNLVNEFNKHGYQTLFIESYCDDHRIIEENVRNVKITSPDYAGWNPADAVKDYLNRISAKIPHFETMTEKDLTYVRMVDAGVRLEVNNASGLGYLLNRIVFYLMNLHIKTHKTYFARAGSSSGDRSFKSDGPLSEEGREYAQRLYNTLMKHREKEEEEFIASGGQLSAIAPLMLWVSTRRRTIETAGPFSKNHIIRQRPQLSQINPGETENMSEEEIEAKWPDEFERRKQDPYHHRYSRAESYHDLAVRLESMILELEREKSDVLIIAHESVLRVLYGYLMATNTMDIPFLRFTRDEIVEIVPGAYNNRARRIPIE